MVIFRPLMKGRWRLALACITLSAILAMVAGVGYTLIQPRFGQGSYFIVPEDGGKSKQNNFKPFDYPLQHRQRNRVVQGTLLMTLGVLHPTIFRVYPDDCVVEFRVNRSRGVNGRELCDYRYGHDVDWSSDVVMGENKIYFRIQNYNGFGGFNVRASPWDPLYFAVLLLTLMSCVLLVEATFLMVSRSVPTRAMLGVVWVGVLLRLVYVLKTPFDWRAYDSWGHTQYIMYVLDNFSVPHASEGWQYYQPPLYYFLNAILLFPLRLFDASWETIIRSAQFISLGLSWAALGIAVWIAHELFRSKNQWIYATAFVAVIAVFPGIVFMSSRLSNDALVVTLSFALFATVLRWWRKPTMYGAVVCASLLGLGLLTKSNFIAFVPVVMIALLVRKGLSLRKRALFSSILLGIIMLLTGWYFFLRIGIESQSHIVGNIGSNPSGLRVEIRPENFYVFRPLEVVKTPYAHAWRDYAGRNRFWEHLLKSAHTGEWDFGFRVHAVMRVMLVLSMLLLTIGMARFLWLLIMNPYNTYIMWSAFFSLVSSMIALVIVENIGGFQDFRYVPGIIIPVTWYVMDGIRVFPFFGRVFAIAMVVLFVILSLFFHYILLFPFR